MVLTEVKKGFAVFFGILLTAFSVAAMVLAGSMLTEPTTVWKAGYVAPIGLVTGLLGGLLLRYGLRRSMLRKPGSDAR